MQEFRLIGQDPILAIGLLAIGAFVVTFILYPLLRVVIQGFYDPQSGQLNLKYFQQYIDPYYAPYQWQVVRDTLIMGIASAVGGTVLALSLPMRWCAATCPSPG